MTWYDTTFLGPVRALNAVKSNVWSVILIITGIVLVMHGHENVGSSLVTGAFAVFRSSKDDTTTDPQAQVVVSDKGQAQVVVADTSKDTQKQEVQAMINP